jgi:hypothetical protein
MKVDALKKSTKAHTRYVNKDGIQIPGVTTIRGILNKPALVKWANNLGLQGIDSSKYRDKAANIGTLAHLMVQNHLSGVKGDYSEYSADDITNAENALISFFEWENNNDIEPIFLEKQFISELHQYGGTIDCYAKLNGKLTLLDFKTSSGIWPEMLHQVAGGYHQLLIENGLEVEQIRILRIGRSEDEGFEDHVVTNANIHWGIFESALKIYNYQQLLKKVS